MIAFFSNLYKTDPIKFFMMIAVIYLLLNQTKVVENLKTDQVDLTAISTVSQLAQRMNNALDIDPHGNVTFKKGVTHNAMVRFNGTDEHGAHFRAGGFQLNGADGMGWWNNRANNAERAKYLWITGGNKNSGIQSHNVQSSYVNTGTVNSSYRINAKDVTVNGLTSNGNIVTKGHITAKGSVSAQNVFSKNRVNANEIHTNRAYLTKELFFDSINSASGNKTPFKKTHAIYGWDFGANGGPSLEISRRVVGGSKNGAYKNTPIRIHDYDVRIGANLGNSQSFIINDKGETKRKQNNLPF